MMMKMIVNMLDLSLKWRKTNMKQTRYKGYYITWFPMEGKWMIFDDNHQPKSGFIHSEQFCKLIIDNY